MGRLRLRGSNLTQVNSHPGCLPGGYGWSLSSLREVGLGPGSDWGERIQWEERLVKPVPRVDEGSFGARLTWLGWAMHPGRWWQPPELEQEGWPDTEYMGTCD